WSLFEQEDRQAFVRWLQALNNAYRGEQALHELDCNPGGLEWIDTHDAERSVVSFLRQSSRGDLIAAVFNFTTVPRTNQQTGVPASGYWRESLNSDALEHGGAGFGNMGGASSVPIPVHGREQSLTLTLPPLGALFLKHEG